MDADIKFTILVPNKHFIAVIKSNSAPNLSSHEAWNHFKRNIEIIADYLVRDSETGFGWLLVNTSMLLFEQLIPKPSGTKQGKKYTCTPTIANYL